MRRTLQFALLVALLALPGFADKKSDYNAAQLAANAGKLDDAVRLFCKVAKEDPNFDGGNGPAQQNCNIYRQTLGVENTLNEQRYNDGVNAFNSGDYSTAEQKFKQIHSGTHLADAQNYLTAKIPAAKQQGAAAAADKKFNDGVSAYNSNNFNDALNNFRQVTGPHAGDAQNYINKIQEYQQAVQQGDSARSGGDYAGALAAYQKAQGIKSDGPGIGDKIFGVQAMMKNASSGGGGGTTVATNTTPQPKPVTVQGAVIETNKPKLDIAKLIKEAQTFHSRGNDAKARGIYLEVLSQDPMNADANAGLKELPQDTSQHAGSEADVFLAKALKQYYSGDYDDAEVSIGVYISNNGAKEALAHFYKGVSELTRYYLNGEQPSDKKLMSKAEDDFREAKKDGNFKPPSDMVSPKIMRVFDQTS